MDGAVGALADLAEQEEVAEGHAVVFSIITLRIEVAAIAPVYSNK